MNKFQKYISSNIKTIANIREISYNTSRRQNKTLLINEIHLDCPTFPINTKRKLNRLNKI